MINSGSVAVDVRAELVSTPPGVTIVDSGLTFGDVPDGATVQSIDTFTVRHDRRFPFAASDLGWNITAGATLRANFRVDPDVGDAPLTVIFFPEPVTDNAIQRYEWDRDGNGTFERSDVIGRTQTFTYSQPGTYQPALRVTDSRGDQDVQTRTVVVGNVPPVVSANVQPSNGPIPLAVNFSGSASDNEGIALYEWDFEGDGIFDYSSPSSASTSFIYTTIGTFAPVFRVTDNLGAATTYTVPTTVITAAPPGTPSVLLNAIPSSGGAPLNVSFSASASDPDGLSIVLYEWDFEGDGSFDASTTTPGTSFSYTQAGITYPVVRVTASDGETASDTAQITVVPQFSLSITADTIDTQLGETTAINTSLGAASRVSVILENRDRQTVRTLVPFTNRSGGSYSDVWDGTDDAGNNVPEGAYYAILLYELDSEVLRFDLTNTTGGQQYNPPRTRMPRRFAPFNEDPLEIDFTLSTASEVIAFMGRFRVNTRLVTFLQREPLGRGTHRIVWNGENGDGILIHPPSRDSFLFGIFAYRFPANGVYVRSGAHISAFSAEPPILSPGAVGENGEPQVSELSFTLSKAADVTLEVNDAVTGLRLATRTYPNVAAGQNTLTWDGKNEAGVLLGQGRYRLALLAVDDVGSRSLKVYTLQRIYH